MLQILALFSGILGCFGLDGNSAAQLQEGYGYVGPACAVFDSTLFLHGVPQRKLSDQELQIFQAYQHGLSIFKDATSFDSFETTLPSVPKFCGGFDDSIEVVLDSCIVRSNHVYVGEQLIRPLSNFERQKIQMVKMRRIYGENRKRRIRRSSPKFPGNRPQRDFSEMLHKLLNINSTVTSRFLPVVSQSPLFAMEGPWQNILDMGKDQSSPVGQFLAQGAPQFQQPVVDITKIDSPYRASFTTMKPVKKENNLKTKKVNKIIVLSTTASTTTESTPIPVTTTATTTTTTIPPPTVREISIETIRPPSTTRRPPTTQKPVEAGGGGIETVVDPVILRMIAKALEKNELVDEIALKEIMRRKRPDERATTPLPLRFVLPLTTTARPFEHMSRISGPSHNHLFIPHQPFTSLASTDPKYLVPTPLSHRLPNEICRVHLNQNPY